MTEAGSESAEQTTEPEVLDEEKMKALLAAKQLIRYFVQVQRLDKDGLLKLAFTGIKRNAEEHASLCTR